MFKIDGHPANAGLLNCLLLSTRWYNSRNYLLKGRAMFNYRFKSFSPHISCQPKIAQSDFSSFIKTPYKLCVVAIITSLFLLFNLSENTAKAEVDISTLKTKKIAFLGTRFQNDHESQEPTSESEIKRILSIETTLKSELETSGSNIFIPLSGDITSKVKEGQPIGECGGCEFDYGNILNADISAWILVQKVSNLILNINLYMVDVKDKKIILTQSVDIRGNTDVSWTKGIKYLIKNHIFKD